MFSETTFTLAVVAIVLVFAGFAVKTKTWWWLPGALMLAGAGLLTLDALTLPPQDYRVVVVVLELLPAFVLVLLGFAVLHGVSAWRERKARLDAIDELATRSPLPRAIVRR
jgi:hypothetical protein